MNSEQFLYLEDFHEGQVINYSRGYKVTEEEIMELAERFDPQPFHIDKQAAEASIFGGLVASSVHLFAMWSAIGNQADGPPVASLSALGFNNMKTLAPARPGDTLYLRVTVLTARPSRSKDDRGILEVSNEVFNQDDETVFTLEHAFLIRKRPKG